MAWCLIRDTDAIRVVLNRRMQGLRVIQESTSNIKKAKKINPKKAGQKKRPENQSTN